MAKKKQERSFGTEVKIAGNRLAVLRLSPNELIKNYSFVIEETVVHTGETDCYWCHIYVSDKEHAKRLLALGKEHFQDHGLTDATPTLYCSGGAHNAIQSISEALGLQIEE